MSKSKIFLKEGLSNFRTVGSICSTSRFVAKAMAPLIHADDPPRVIVELGVGTGNITGEIIKYLRPCDYFLGIDSNQNLLEVCRNHVYAADNLGTVNLEHGFAQNIKDILLKYRIEEADEVVCTIPFRILPKKDTKIILQQVNEILKPGGHFTFIRYTLAPENKEITETLSSFKIVEKKTIVRNIPPAEVVKMQKA